jgi:hypothetical protein
VTVLQLYGYHNVRMTKTRCLVTVLQLYGYHNVSMTKTRCLVTVLQLYGYHNVSMKNHGVLFRFYTCMVVTKSVWQSTVSCERSTTIEWSLSEDGKIRSLWYFDICMVDLKLPWQNAVCYDAFKASMTKHCVFRFLCLICQMYWWSSRYYDKTRYIERVRQMYDGHTVSIPKHVVLWRSTTVKWS